MKKTLLVSAIFFLFSGIGKAAKNEAAVKTTTASSAEPIATLPAANPATAISAADLLKENQALKLLLNKAVGQNDNLDQQLNYAYNMYFTTMNLYEVQLEKQQEDARLQAEFAWTMHAVLLNLNQLSQQ